MADRNVGGAGFWADLSKKTGTWSGVAALVVAAAEIAESALSDAPAEPGWHHAVAVVAAAVIRAIVGLVQGKIGDPSKASFAPGPTVNVPASQLRDVAGQAVTDPDD